ncbi:MAG TPA: CHAP domain-containing protein [Nitrososphaeraceae archaeon]
MTPSEIARTYIGKLEKPNNSGFQDPAFENDMKDFGEWKKGYSWCACFAQMCFRQAFQFSSDSKHKDLQKLFDPSTRKTLDNFRAAKYTVSVSPVKEALVIFGDYENGKLTWRGHAGIVSQVIDNNTFKSIEGNTSGGGSRNGDRVWEHLRTTTIKANGLNVLGFVII